ncbi:O-acetylhomoserine aminocarboxypropyltransferase/cysteine synthase family protein [Eubacterium oxidoreducens]|uniref:homocysteine desulfhydrase n=1 Tax=Eubacterium oxidoreducens TaxID=1732 RepID=A0A1G6C236_EUBOX|nr:aminotransferase class I/II-fold pyridoxal phosphate-dependent enzyme [Eubacterium oxidoreducens]SDB26924.1 O-acetylhomoserine (thiol)-lyase [Eubacterium oxidoreducens]
MEAQRFDTAKIHAGYNPAEHNWAISVPIYQTVAFELDNINRGLELFSFNSSDSLYTRVTNPTTEILEKRIVKMHPGATGAVAVASGMAAVSYSLLNVTGGSGRILASPRLYGGSFDSFEQIFKEYGVQVDLVPDPDDIKAYEEAIKEDTKCIYIESVSNPNATVLDIEKIAQVAHQYGIPLIVDNTLATPYLINPFEFGADVVVYSATKGLTGHGNVMAGIVVENGKFNWNKDKYPQFFKTPYFLNDLDGTPRSFLDLFVDIPFTGRIRAVYLNYMGAALSPFNAYLALIGIETLSERLNKQLDNTKKIISFLESRDEVAWVKHPWAQGSPYKKLAEKYAPKGAAAILSFGLKGDLDTVHRLLDSVKIFSLQANIGDARSLIINPAQTTHGELTPEDLQAADIDTQTIRLSIGLEDVKDLIEDLKQAFEQL